MLRIYPPISRGVSATTAKAAIFYSGLLWMLDYVTELKIVVLFNKINNGRIGYQHFHNSG
jgi:hypothetical protein